MLNPPLLAGLQSVYIETARLRTHMITCGPADGEVVILIHGNTATGRAFEELMVALPAHLRAIAPDLRGYGRSAPAPVDATRGMRDFSDDIAALAQTLGIQRAHLVGWSLGGCIAMQYAIDHPQAVASLTLLAPGSPYGFGATRDLEGTPTNPDYSGSGGGLVNPEILRRMRAGDHSDDSPLSPINRIVSTWFKPPFRPARLDVLLEEFLLTTVGPDNYPGDSSPSEYWPGTGPGTRGVACALSPKYCNVSDIVHITPKPPILWVRGDADRLVADGSLLDAGFLGQLGVLPGWPGAAVYPPQPMVGQTRAVLERYAAAGGRYRELVLEACAHSPHVERPDLFYPAFFAFLATGF